MFLFLQRFEAQIVLRMFLFFLNISLYRNGLIMIANQKDMRNKILITKQSNLSVRLIDVIYNNNTVTIFVFIYSSSLINQEQK